MITVFGSINIDLVQRTTHFSAPGETVLCDSYELIPSGKGANQALAAARAGASTAMIGRVQVADDGEYAIVVSSGAN